MRLVACLLEDDELMLWIKLWFYGFQGWYIIISVVSKEVQRESDDAVARQSHCALVILFPWSPLMTFAWLQILRREPAFTSTHLVFCPHAL